MIFVELDKTSLLRNSGRYGGLTHIFRLIKENGTMSLGCYTTELAAQAALTKTNS